MASFEPAVLISAADVHQQDFRSGPLVCDNTMSCERKINSLLQLHGVREGPFYYMGNDPRYWRWLSLEDDVDVEVAQLLDVCWLEVKGKIEMKRLEKGVKYDVMFVILMIDPSGFEPKATLSLELSSGKTLERKVSLQAIKPKQWTKVKVGDFVATEEKGDVIFSLTNYEKLNWKNNYEKLNWKKGMIIEGVLIQART